MKKIKLSDFAKDLNLKCDDLIKLFEERGYYRKKPGSALSEEDANWILEWFTKNNEVDSFDEFLSYERKLKYPIRTGTRVRGIVVSVDYSEVTVDLGTHYIGYITLHDLTIDLSKKANDIVQVGDEIIADVIKVNDAEGIVQLRSIDITKQLEEQKHQKEEHRNEIIANKVIAQVQDNLTAMKPSLISDIAFTVYSQLEKNVYSENAELKLRVSELEKRVLHLESIIDGLSNK